MRRGSIMLALAAGIVAAGCSLLASFDGLVASGDAGAGAEGVDASKTDGASSVDASAADATPGSDATAGLITFVQAKGASLDNAGSLDVSFDAPVKAHDTIVLGIDLLPIGAQVMSVSDSLGSAFTTIQGPFDRQAVRMYVVMATDVPKDGHDTITVTLDSTAPVLELYAHEYANIVSFDQGVTAGGYSDASDGMESPPITTTVPNELLFAYAVTGTAISGSGFTLRSDFNGNFTEDLLAATPGTYAAKGTMTHASGRGYGWAMLAATFKGPR